MTIIILIVFYTLNTYNYLQLAYEKQLAALKGSRSSSTVPGQPGANTERKKDGKSIFSNGAQFSV